MQDAYIIDIKRSPIGKANKGVLAQLRPDDWLASVIRQLLKTHDNVDPHQIDDVIIGCAMPEAHQGMNIARMALKLAGLPDVVSGMTINRFCASGLESIAIASQRIALGQADIIIAGGVESMSMLPMTGHQLRLNPSIFNHEDTIGLSHAMGTTAEKVALLQNIDRARQDDFSLRSHQLAHENQQQIKPVIYPVSYTQRGCDLANQKDIVKTLSLDHDEGIRGDCSIDQLSALSPVFGKNGTITPGNSSQRSDAAAVALLMSKRMTKQFGCQPKAQLMTYQICGLPADIMGMGPVYAIPKALKKCNLTMQDIDWIELNEAFAAQTLAVIDQLDLPKAKVNPYGGAIASGHPLGASGAIRSATAIHAMTQGKARHAMVSMCIGLGMGACGIFKAID